MGVRYNAFTQWSAAMDAVTIKTMTVNASIRFHCLFILALLRD